MKSMDRLGALSGAAYIVLGISGSSLLKDPLLPDAPTGRETLISMRRLADNPVAQAGLSLELLSFVAWIAFVGYIGWSMRAAGWVAITAVVSGSVSIAVHLGFAATPFTEYLLRDELSPELARVLTDLNVAAFMLHLVPFGLFVLSTAAAALNTHAMGRVLGWSGIAIGAVVIVTAAVTGVRIDETAFVPQFLVALMWVLVVSVYWSFFHSRVRKAAPATPQTS